MMWRKFIASVCLVFAAYTSFGCAWGQTPIEDLYMFKSYFRPYDYGSWHSYGDYGVDEEGRVANDGNVAFWHTYTNGRVDKQSIYQALYKLPLSGIDNGTNRFFTYLKEQNDEEALNYWRMTKRFTENIADPWYYPTLNDRKDLLETARNLQDACQQGGRPELSERYLLQTMRISFYLKEYTLCLQLWKDAPKTFKDADIQKKFTNYYAGALLHIGEKASAANLYGSTSDWTSLCYLPHDVAFLEDLYTSYPRSRAFDYLIQQFANQYQDYRNKDQSAAFTKLADRVLKEKKTDNPVLWQSALAHIAYLDGDIATAVSLIEKAATMDGTPIAKENARILRLLYHAADGKARDYDAKIAADLPWLIQKVHDLPDEERWTGFSEECHYINILRIIIFKYLEPHYSSTGNSNLAIAILNAYDEAYLSPYSRERIGRNSTTDSYTNEYTTHSFSYLDTTTVANANDFLAFVQSGGKSDLEKSLIKMGHISESYMNELIGTKYIRTGDYKNAIAHLQKVSPNFFKTQRIRNYLTFNPFSEYWITRQGERRQYGTYNPAKIYAKNPSKLQFCQIMCELEQKIAECTDPEEKAQLLYAFSVGTVQKCSNDMTWAISHYVKGLTWTMYEACYRYGLHDGPDTWDYENSICLQIQNTCKSLQEAERMTRNPELAARCQYLQSHLEPDAQPTSVMHNKMADNFANTDFFRNEIRHCDRLSDYRYHQTLPY